MLSPQNAVALLNFQNLKARLGSSSGRAIIWRIEFTMGTFRYFLASLSLLLTITCGLAQDATTLVDGLAVGSFKERETAISTLVSSGSPVTVPVLQALTDGTLFVRKSDRRVFIATASGDIFKLLDPTNNADAGQAAKGELEKIKVNNALREIISNAMSGLTLFSKDVTVRKDAALVVLKSGDTTSLPALEKAIPAESDPAVAEIMRLAAAAATLKSDRPDTDKLAAIETLAKQTDRDTASLLKSYAANVAEPLKAAALAAAQKIESSLSTWTAVQNIWFGLSLASVLLLAAIGLAITFGVMGVINMAHGEMVMLGAYTTFVVEQLFVTYFPAAADYALLAAIPSAFVVSALMGIAIERSVIRYLYGRPLETLLATWGVSLMLQQAVRSLFGPTNKSVTTPSWMSGSIDFSNGLSFTLNRVAILVFALAIFAGLMILIKRTPLGLQMRAVTQNRPMANAMGIRSSRIDALTFGLGSGIAGLAGVALSQIDNVSPNLGQSYIIDSFLVVVFGGVGNLWGTLAGALTLGIANKFLEPFAGAVLAKIFILIAVILFIQKKPRGLFALKGRWVDA
jgi:urea transport system permease protein